MNANYRLYCNRSAGHIMWFPNELTGYGGTAIDIDQLVMDSKILQSIGVPRPYASEFGGNVKDGRNLLARAIREKLNSDNDDFAKALESGKPMIVYYYIF